MLPDWKVFASICVKTAPASALRWWSNDGGRYSVWQKRIDIGPPCADMAPQADKPTSGCCVCSGTPGEYINIPYQPSTSPVDAHACVLRAVYPVRR